MLSWPHRTSNNIINICFRLLETCAKCSYFIEENMRPGVQRLAFEVKFEYIAHRSTNIPWAGGLRLGKFPDNRRLITLLRVYWCLFSHSMKLRNYCWNQQSLSRCVTCQGCLLPIRSTATRGKTRTTAAWSEHLKICRHAIVTQQRPTVQNNPHASLATPFCRERSGLEFITRDPTFGEFVPRLGISATFGEKFGELRYLGIF